MKSGRKPDFMSSRKPDIKENGRLSGPLMANMYSFQYGHLVIVNLIWSKKIPYPEPHKKLWWFGSTALPKNQYCLVVGHGMWNPTYTRVISIVLKLEHVAHAWKSNRSFRRKKHSISDCSRSNHMPSTDQTTEIAPHGKGTIGLVHSKDIL